MEALVNKSLASIAIMVFTPVISIVAISILLVDGRPILFRQERLGLGLQTFTIFKFRTMKDGQVTRTGRWLRSTGLDELAQLFNIARGDMNIVGPRPLTESERVRLGYATKSHLDRWSIKPGLTGLCQVVGGISAEDSWKLDELYIKKRSLSLDITLVLITLAMNLGGKRPVRKILQSTPLLNRKRRVM